MAAVDQLPERAAFRGVGTVRWFRERLAAEFERLPSRRAIPSVLRKLYRAAAPHVANEAPCLICAKTLGPSDARIIVAVETDGGGHDLGCVCFDCAQWAFGLGND